MRLFVAIVPPTEALAELSAAVEPLHAAAPQLRWAGCESWHLTLAFLGDVEQRALAELSTRLGRAAARHPVQQLAIAGAGGFPSASRARVLWAGVRADNRGLASLAASVAAGARRAGAPPPDEGRQYRPHLTLARCREPADVTELAQALAGFTGSGWTATGISLIRSNPAGQPRYEELASWPLKARSEPK
jgi:RNA 2',3'-cyclic 3'-phosphodiesterase